MGKKQVKKELNEQANERLLSAARTDSFELIRELSSTEQGHSEESIELMRETFGENTLTPPNPDTWFKRLKEAFVNPFTVILFVLAVVSLFTDVIFASTFGGERDAAAVIIVLSMIGVSGIVRFIQESKSSNAAQKLKEMITTTTCVQRQSGKQEIALSEVVVGDIICLAAGDMVPADVRIISCKDLFIGQSSLTGESRPIEKTDEIIKFSHKNSLELNNLAFLGSNVISGSATAVVVNVGDDTHMGRLSASLTKDKTVSGFEKGVRSVSFLLIRFMLIMVPVIFFVNGLVKGVISGGGGRSWLDALMFAMSVAVGLTPEMLPMIVAAGLAKGAVRISKKKTVVKNLSSIQAFGAMDILCTDKTGTLTLDEIVLEKYLDVHGNEDKRILRHAFLNSYFQTGLKNLMDKAVLNHSSDEDIVDLPTRYTKVDEIPFDFTRRRMSVVIKDRGGKTQLITKGAVEEMLSICTYAECGGVVEPMTAAIKNNIMGIVSALNKDGMRVLAVAQKTNPSAEGVFGVADESDMVLIGYLAFLDPPKPSAKQAIKALNDYGVRVKILTGDNAEITKCIAAKVGLNASNILLGTDIEDMSDEDLSVKAQSTDVFAKLSPMQKVRIVSILKSSGHTVGFLGDGINDAPALKEADVGISVDTGVDIAKESADIVLLEKDLSVLEQGIIEGRKTFANIVKYVKMTASSSFGNMLSVLVASAFLPFLPMLPIQILILNLIYDFSCVSIPWDNVDKDYIKKPKQWEAKGIGRFMLLIGPISSVFDIIMFALLFFVICPLSAGGAYSALSAGGKEGFEMIFQSGWFVMSLWSQTLVIHMLRTKHMPFVKSRASRPVMITTVAAVVIGTALPFTVLAEAVNMKGLSPLYFAVLVGIIAAYMACTQVAKWLFSKKFGELL